MTLRLKVGLPSNPRTWPILSGRVKVEGLDLVANTVPTTELFWRQLRFAEFDVSEMSLSSMITAQFRGDERWTGVPVFTTRRFFHAGILVRRDAGIQAPGDLKGKRFGLPEYQQTGALWLRGILQHEFGVLPRDIEFWTERAPLHCDPHDAGPPPPGVTIHRIAPEKNLGTMMLSGELQAALYYRTEPNPIDRSTADLWSRSEIKTLFDDPVAEAARYCRKTGIYPINHAMVICREIAQAHPWIVENLVEAFNRANDIADCERMEHVEYHLASGLVPHAAKEALQTRIVQHGIAPNRHVLETATRYAFEQSLTPRLVQLGEIFAV